jgi:hypothetical protein
LILKHHSNLKIYKKTKKKQHYPIPLLASLVIMMREQKNTLSLSLSLSLPLSLCDI